MMLARKVNNEETTKSKCTPNVLPCQTQHDGPVNASERLWAPEIDKDGKLITHLRGRRLQGKLVKVPETHRGAVIVKTNEKLAQRSEQECSNEVDAEDDDMDETQEEVKLYEEQASFDELVVWEHETMPDAKEDPFIRSVEEWIGFAEQMHSFEKPAESVDERVSKG